MEKLGSGLLAFHELCERPRLEQIFAPAGEVVSVNSHFMEGGIQTGYHVQLRLNHAIQFVSGHKPVVIHSQGDYFDVKFAQNSSIRVNPLVTIGRGSIRQFGVVIKIFIATLEGASQLPQDVRLQDFVDGLGHVATCLASPEWGLVGKL